MQEHNRVVWDVVQTKYTGYLTPSSLHLSRCTVPLPPQNNCRSGWTGGTLTWWNLRLGGRGQPETLLVSGLVVELTSKSSLVLFVVNYYKLQWNTVIQDPLNNVSLSITYVTETLRLNLLNCRRTCENW